MMLEGNPLKLQDFNEDMQINQSSVFAFLGNRGIGVDSHNPSVQPKKEANACSLLAYYDIVYNYYANKQEEIGFQIHNDMSPINAVIHTIEWTESDGTVNNVMTATTTAPSVMGLYDTNNKLEITFVTGTLTQAFDIDSIKILMQELSGNWIYYGLSRIYNHWIFDFANQKLIGTDLITTGQNSGQAGGGYVIMSCGGYSFSPSQSQGVQPPKLEKLDLIS